MTRVATYNAPHRYGVAKLAHDFQHLADLGAKVIAAQEVTGTDAAALCPPGWVQYRPAQVRSEALYWDPGTYRAKVRGAYRVHSEDWDTPRFILWALLENLHTGEVTRMGSVQLIAFKTSNPAHAREFRFQSDRVATWLTRPGRRVTMGDMNATAGSGWLAPVDAVAHAHTPQVHSGPDGQPIDLIYTAGLPHATSARTVPGASDHDAVLAVLDA